MATTKDTYRANIQGKIEELIDEANERHNKVLPIRMDFHFPQGYQHNGENEEIQKLHKRVSRRDRYRRTDSRYLTVREQNTSDCPHYHTLLLVDGNKHQNPRGIQEEVASIWLDIVGSDQKGIVNFCKHQEGYPIPPLEMIRRPSSRATGEQLEKQTAAFEKARQVALDHADYLAKETTKGNAPDGVREMLASQVRPKR